MVTFVISSSSTLQSGIPIKANGESVGVGESKVSEH